MARGLLWGLACVVVGACSPYDANGAFACTQDTQCDPGGTCSAGFCAFPDNGCSSGLKYGSLAGSLSNQCVGANDAGVDGKIYMDAHIDTPPNQFCYGTGIVTACFSAAPTGTTKLTADIDTGGSSCATTLNNTGACVIAAGTLDIDAGVTVHATGTKPLVLVASASITIAGTLDIASHRGGQTGAGADLAGCNAGTAPVAATGGGGGAGGSFGGKGGHGGSSYASAAGGIAGNALTPTALRGGCKGQDGAGAAVGAGGAGGGAVYMIATTSIFVSGTINASGAGATSALSGSSGGGGGGAGGYIGLESSSVTASGSAIIFATGGGGGEASGSTTGGNPGSDPSAPATPAPGGTGGSTNGGDGGNGAAGATLTGAAGGMGNTAGGAGGGGGGGGAPGIIKVLPAGQVLGGMVAPPQT